MSTREALLLVPGIRSLKQGEFLDEFVASLERTVESASIKNQEDAEIGGLKGKRIAVKPVEGEQKEIDIYETYYSDLVPNLAAESPLSKLRDGTSMMLFWLSSGIWRGLGTKTNKYMTVTGLVSASMLFVWYLTVLAVGLKAIGQLAISNDSQLVTQATAYLGRVGDWLFNWTTLIGLGVFLNFFPVDRLANISHFLRLFISEPQFRGTIRARIRTPLLKIVETHNYSSVTVVAHSFGVLATTDVLADFRFGKIRVMTLGGPLALLQYVNKWIREEWKKCQLNDAITSWLDFYSGADYMGDQSPFAKHDDKSVKWPFIPQTQKLEDMGGLVKRLTGGTHREYFNRTEVMESVIQWPDSKNN